MTIFAFWKYLDDSIYDLHIFMSWCHKPQRTLAHTILNAPTVSRAKRETQDADQIADCRERSLDFLNAPGLKLAPTIIDANVLTRNLAWIGRTLPNMNP